MLLAALMLCIPLGMRYFTSWHMTRLRQRALHEDEALRRLRQDYADLRSQVMNVRHQQRQYEVRKSHLLTDIHAQRARLQQLRRPVKARLAA